MIEPRSETQAQSTSSIYEWTVNPPWWARRKQFSPILFVRNLGDTEIYECTHLLGALTFSVPERVDSNRPQTVDRADCSACCGRYQLYALNLTTRFRKTAAIVCRYLKDLEDSRVIVGLEGTPQCTLCTHIQSTGC